MEDDLPDWVIDGYQPPSARWMEATVVSDEENAYAVRAKVFGWVIANAHAVKPEAWFDVVRDEFSLANNIAANKSDKEAGLLFQQRVWHRFGLLPTGDFLSFARPRRTPPLWLLEALGLDTMYHRGVSLKNAFIANGKEGYGRISSSQVVQGLMLCLFSDKTKWTVSAKGWPRFVYAFNQQEIAYTLKPEVAPTDEGEETEQLKRVMFDVRDRLSSADYDIATILMAQTLRESQHGMGQGYISADHILQYRDIEKKRVDGKTRGHQQSNLDRVARSMKHLSYLHVSTNTLLKAGGTRHRGREALSIDSKFLSVRGDISTQEDGRVLAWDYQLGTWFGHFMEDAHQYIALENRQAVLYDPAHEPWPKQLAHYLTLEMRKNASNGQELGRYIATLMDGACIPESPQPIRVIDKIDEGIRRIVLDGLFRIKDGDEWLDNSTQEMRERVRVWSCGRDLPARGRMEALKGRKIVLRAEPFVEQEYTREVRKIKGEIRQIQRAP